MNQPSEAVSPPAAPGVRPARRRPWWLALAASLVLLAGAGWYGWRWYTTPEIPAIPLDNVEAAVVKAIQTARAQVLQEPRSAATWGELGMVLEANSFTPQAQVCYARAEELDPEDRRWPYFLGMLTFHSQPTEGLRHLRRAVALSDAQEAFEPRLRLALALVDLNQQEEAEHLFRELLKERPDFPQVHLNLGWLAYNRRDVKESLSFLRKAAGEQGTRKTALRLLAQIYKRLGRQEEADRAGYQEAQLPDDGGWPDPIRRQIDNLAVTRDGRIRLVIQLQDQDKYQESIPLLRDIAHDFPDDSRNYLNLGLAHLRLNEFDEAEKQIAQALARDRNSVNANYSLGAVYYSRAVAESKKAGKPELVATGLRAGAPLFQKVVELKPNHARAHFMLGEWLLIEHREAKALEEYQTALLCQPDFPEAHTRLAELQLAWGQDARALVHLHYALVLASNDAERIQLLGRLVSRSVLWK
jgi:tetratricopeptide (TPR) repeat protein